MNTFKTFLLMFGLMILFMFVGRIIGGSQGIIVFFLLGLVMNLITYWFSDKIVLSIYRAKPIKYEDNPQLYKMIAELSQKANIPEPKIYIIDQESPNAFATGRNPQNAVVCVTTGILEILSENELRGVLAHELSHIKNRDILIATIAAVIASAISMISSIARWGMIFGGGSSRDRDEDNGGGLAILFAAIIAPIIAVIIQFAISRSREYQADRTGGIISNSPGSLANALSKLTTFTKKTPMLHTSSATAHLFIVNPFSGKSLLTLFSTHPPVQERIKRLQQLSLELEQKKYNFPEIIKE